MDSTTAFVPLKDYVETLWPADLLDMPDLSALDGAWIEPMISDFTFPELTIDTALLFEVELALGIPGVDAVKLVLAPSGALTAFQLRIELGAVNRFSLIDVPIALRLSADLLKPARRVPATEPGQGDTFAPDTTAAFVDIQLAKISLSIDTDGNFTVDGGVDITLPPSFIGDTGVVIEASDIKLYLDANSPPPGKPAGWRGIHIAEAGLYLPGDLGAAVGHLQVLDAYIGNGGFSGTVADTWTPPLAATLLGTTFSLQHVELTFVQNALTASAIAAQVTLPFFDEPVDVAIGINLDGSFSVALTGAHGLVTLTKADIVSFELDSLGFTFAQGTFVAKLSGKLTPLVAGLSWPTFDVKELSIDSHGNVHLDGGWLDLPDQYMLDFHGFQITIAKIGFGTRDDGYRWIGFSGGLKLVDGLSAGASVDGLKIAWNDAGDVGVTLDGVGVELEVPDVVRFSGAVSYSEPTPGEHRFDGSIVLELIALDFEIDATLVIGTMPAVGDQPGYTYFAIYLDCELPAGIPLWATGLGIYGFAGLFALNMKPNRTDDQPWYEIGSTTDWFHKPHVGVTDLKTKWEPADGAIALGAGITIGTEPDNGFTFSGKMLLVISIPGPIIMIQGAANLLKERSSLDDNPIFRALVVLDFNAGSFLIGIDFAFGYGDGGELIEIHGGCEAFFSTSDPSAWHLYLGIKDPKAKRVRANILQLFEADTYFMVDAHQLAMGAWVGYDKTWSFGPVSVTVEAWIDGNVVLSWKPLQLHGDLWLHGKAALKVFGFGLSLTVDAKFAADVFRPFDVKAEFSVAIDLPWPLPDFSFDITLEFGPTPVPPPLPLPLKEIAAEHFKVTTSWPLPRTSAPPLLVPNYDADADGFFDSYPPDGTLAPAALAAPPPAAASIPVVPLDARPHVTFGRAVHDLAPVGVNAQPVTPDMERLGDPSKNQGPTQVRYSLVQVALDRFDGTWQPVARAGTTANPPGVPRLYGSWAPMPAMPDGAGANPAQVKLWLWSKTPFDYTAHSGSSWDEWFTGKYPDYPCIPAPPPRELCCDFENVALGRALRSPFTCDATRIVIAWYRENATIDRVAADAGGRTHALCLTGIDKLPSDRTFAAAAPALGIAAIFLPAPAQDVTIELAPPVKGNAPAAAFGLDADGNTYGPFAAVGALIDVRGDGIVRVDLEAQGELCIVRVCCTIGETQAQSDAREAMMQHLRDELARWSQTGNVLEPNATYRVAVTTKVETSDASVGADATLTELAYFRTEGPPGLATLSTPLNAQAGDAFASGLDDLTLYVDQTVPQTVPPPGQKPSLPKPVYRGYDVGVRFNEDYVDLMYRLAGRDLGLYLYDANNKPVRDAQGRLIVTGNRWGHADDVTLTDGDKLWLTLVNTSTCAALDTTTIPHDVTLASPAQVLAPDIVYEARLIPLLLHETFDAFAAGTAAAGPAGTLGRWQVRDEGALLGPSHWEVRRDAAPVVPYVVQTTDVYGGTVDASDPVKPGTLLLYGDDPALDPADPLQPGAWTDYRVTVTLRSSDDDALGVVFRYVDESTYYRFSLDRERRYRRLVAVVAGRTVVLGEDDFVYQLDADYTIVVEAVGQTVAVYQDGAQVFRVDDAVLDHGRIGLYAWADQGARFADVRVDDFRAAAPVVYRFRFTTSNFVDVFHHLHDFDDETWAAELPGGTDVASIAAAVAAAVAPPAPAAPPADAESRAYETLASAAFGAQAAQPSDRVALARVASDGAQLALVLRSPEPLDWARTTVALAYAPGGAPAGTIPHAAKLTGVTFGAAHPNDESVSLLLRGALDPSGYRVEVLVPPGPLVEPAEDPTLFADRFDGPAAGRLFTETFGPNARDGYTIVDGGTWFAPSQWSVSGGALAQSSLILGGTFTGVEKFGTLAVTGSSAWTDVRVRATLRSTATGALGVVFRYKDDANYYRFSMEQWHGYRRLVKVVAGTVTVLWEDAVAYVTGTAYAFDAIACAGRLTGYLDGMLLFDVSDRDVAAGRVGLYAWANGGARFDALTVESVDAPPVLWKPAFASAGEVTPVDETGAVGGPSVWTAAGGVLTQSANVSVPDATPWQPGTYAFAGDGAWTDVAFAATLRSPAAGALGVMFRYTDGDDYYRFALDLSAGRATLIVRAAGAVSVLWTAPFAAAPSGAYATAITARGDTIAVRVNGVLLATVYDTTLLRGRVALYARANPAAAFSDVLVADAAQHVGAWTIHDDAHAGGPSSWRRANGVLQQRAAIGDPALPKAAGTTATVGLATWTDYRLTVRFRTDDDAAVGAVVRYADAANYYRLSVDRAHGYRRLIKCASGVVTALWQDAAPVASGVDHTLVIDAVGARLTGYLDGTQLFDVTDGDVRAGSVGLYTAANTGARFERVLVEDPPPSAYALFADGFAAGDDAAWAFVDEGTHDAPSHWALDDGALRQTSLIYEPPLDGTTVAKRGTHAVAGDTAWTDVILDARVRSDDVDSVGVMVRYQDAQHYYRFSMDAGFAFRRLVKNVGGTFTTLWEDATSYASGQTYRITLSAIGSELRGYVDGVPAFVVQDGDVASGAIALYSWWNDDGRFASVRVFPASRAAADALLADRFGALVPGRWTFVDEGTADAPSAWSVDAERGLVQTSAIGGGDPAAIDQPGTYAVAGDPSWDDYRVTVRLSSGAAGAVGVVFRCAGPDDLYRLSFDGAGGYRRLVKKSAGTYAELWSDAAAFAAGREYVVTVDCTGDHITGYVDGVRVFSVEDGALPAGQAGVYAHGNAAAVFREVRVAAPQWSAYYTFDDEQLGDPGTKFRVLSGSAAAVPPPAPAANVTDRFAAALNDPGTLRFPGTDAVALRLVDASGTVVHARTFLPDTAFAPLAAARIARKADGTGLAIVVPSATPAGTHIDPGHYRLQFTYLRDNRAQQPASIVYTEAGASDPEIVTLDAPWQTVS